MSCLPAPTLLEPPPLFRSFAPLLEALPALAQDGAPPAIAWPGAGLLLPALLVLFGAICGGLRSLLASPLRGALLEPLAEEHRRALLQELERRGRHLTIAAGILRLVCVVLAAVLVLRQSETLPSASRWPVWAGAMAVAGILLESVPTLAARGRLLGSLLAALPLVRLLGWPLLPLTRLIDAVLRAAGADPAPTPSDSLAADLIQVAKEQDRASELDDTERRMIARLIDLPEVDVAEVMTPRTELTSVPVESSVAEALQRAGQDGHSRILVHEEDLDHVVGVFYVKDALPLMAADPSAAAGAARDLMREPYFVPETMRVPALLEELRRRRVHLAVVVDEYGGTAGVVTVEDLLEEIVGDIEDEHDPAGGALHFERRSADELIVDGRYPVADLNEEFDVTLPEDKDYDTLAGLLFDRFGHIPTGGETVQVDGVVFEVLEADDRRIQRVRVTRVASPAVSDLA